MQAQIEQLAQMDTQYVSEQDMDIHVLDNQIVQLRSAIECKYSALHGVDVWLVILISIVFGISWCYAIQRHICCVMYSDRCSRHD